METNTSTAAKTTKAAKTETRGCLSTSDTIRLYEMLKANLDPAGGGLFTYKAGFSDKKIADDLNLLERTVMMNRVKLFGKLKLNKVYVPYHMLIQKLEALEKRVEELEAAITAPK